MRVWQVRALPWSDDEYNPPAKRRYFTDADGERALVRVVVVELLPSADNYGDVIPSHENVRAVPFGF